MIRGWRRGLGLGLLLLVLATAIFALSCRALEPRQAAAPAPNPNIILFLTDDQRAELLEYMPIVQRELVARGVTFTNAYATTPLCCPSRASILTGLYAHKHGVLANSGSRGGWRVFDPSSTVATWLQAAGWRTMLVGKYLNLYKTETVPPGWTKWFAILDSGHKYYDYTVNNGGRLRDYGDKERWYSADVLTRRALELLDNQPELPFLLYLSFDGPHAPAEPAVQDRKRFADLPPLRTPSFNEADVSDKPGWVQRLPLLEPDEVRELDLFRQQQIETLQSIDRGIGAVIEKLEADGRLANTWLIFMSDNGISLGEHRYGQHKSCGYEECTRVPLVIAPPPGQEAAVGAPRLDHRLALNIDLAPTLADLAGVPPGRPTDGLSLRPLLADPNLAWDRAGLLELWAEEGDFPFEGLRYDRWKYLRYVTGEEELYDLAADPYELDNLAAQPEQAARLADLSARLDAVPR